MLPALFPRSPEPSNSRSGWLTVALLSAVTVLVVAPVQANPPPPSTFPVPDVQPLRVTWGSEFGGLRGLCSLAPCYDLMFEVQNWTDQDVYGVLLTFTDADFEDVMMNPPPRFLDMFEAFVESDGRPAFGTGDDANFPGGANPDGTGDPVKAGATNNFVVTAASATSVLYTLDSKSFSGIPSRDLLGATDSAAACALVPGCSGPDLTIANPEQIDNGQMPDNVLDGFVVTFSDFFAEEVGSLNFYLLDINGAPIGYDDGTQIIGNGFAFGVINVFQVDGYAGTRSHGPPVWTRQTRAGTRGATPTGNTGTEDPPANLRDMFPGPTPQTLGDDPNLVFQVEIGAALTGRFADVNDAPPGADSNADTQPNFPVELMSFSIED